MRMSGKPVLVSIDTEGPCGCNFVDKLIWGRTADGVNAGIEMLLDIFDSNGVKGLFFVDIAEAWECGSDSIREVLLYIDGRGHDIGVHIHPDRMCDPNRRYLWEYSVAEQRDMINKCTSLYEGCLGRKPKSFRAGRYGINEDTLDILRECGYIYDMSIFYGNKYCHVKDSITCNKLVDIKGIKEIPVSVFKSFNAHIYERYDKVDVAMDISEFKRVVNRMANDDSIDVISFFVHSFSLLNWRKKPDSPTFLKREATKLDSMIKYMKKLGYVFVDENYLEKLNYEKEGNFSVTDYSRGIVTWWFFLKRAIRVINARLINNI